MHHLSRILGAFIASSAIIISVHAATAPALSVTILPLPAASAIPQGAQRVAVLNLRLQASCTAPVTISSLSITHSGLGAASDILRIYAFDGTIRRSRSVSVSSKDAMTLRLQNVTVPVCGTVTLIVDADFSRTAQSGGEHRFDLKALDANATVTIGHIGASRSSQSVTPSANQATVTAEFRPVITDVSYGADKIVARLILTGGKDADQRVLSVTFTNDGSARNADLQNLYLETNGHARLTPSVAHMDGRTVTLMFDPPLLLSRNQSIFVQLRADVRASRTHTIQWLIEEPSDIQAIRA